MKKKLILIRHAHRDNTIGSLDNGLSGKGKDQAKALRRFFSERFPPEDLRQGLWLVSSPKKRCIETLQPIANMVERKVDIHPDLVEQKANESMQVLEERVHRFLYEWSQSKVPLSLVCSHGDWLPIAIFHLLGVSVEVKKGSWCEVEWQSSQAELKWYIPSFRSFFPSMD